MALKRGFARSLTISRGAVRKILHHQRWVDTQPSEGGQ